MSRVRPVSPTNATGYAARLFRAQTERYGAPLLNHLVYARRPDLFRAFRGVWNTLNSDGILDAAIVALVNRRVASVNGCVF